MDFLDDDVIEPKVTNMQYIRVLHDDLMSNVSQIDALLETIHKAEEETNVVVDNLEDLYRNEFSLYMEHIGIYEDLIKRIEEEQKTVENEFELARIKKEATKNLRVGVIEI